MQVENCSIENGEKALKNENRDVAHWNVGSEANLEYVNCIEIENGNARKSNRQRQMSQNWEKHECVMLFRHINKLMWILSRSSASNASINKFAWHSEGETQKKLALELSKNKRKFWKMTIWDWKLFNRKFTRRAFVFWRMTNHTKNQLLRKILRLKFSVSMASPNGYHILCRYNQHIEIEPTIFKHLHAWRIDNFEIHKRCTEALPTQKIHLKLHLMLFTVVYIEQNMM